MYLDRTVRDVFADEPRPSLTIVLTYRAVTRVYLAEPGTATREVVTAGFPVRPDDHDPSSAEATHGRLDRTARRLAYLGRVERGLREVVPPGDTMLLVGEFELVRELARLAARTWNVIGSTVDEPGSGAQRLSEPDQAAMLRVAEHSSTPTPRRSSPEHAPDAVTGRRELRLAWVLRRDGGGRRRLEGRWRVVLVPEVARIGTAYG